MTKPKRPVMTKPRRPVMTKPKRPRGGMTADEFDAWLKETGQYDAMVDLHRQQEEERDKREAEYVAAEAPLVAELRAAGFQVESAWDLINTGSYPKAVPILLSHIPRPYPPAVREGIARALGAPLPMSAWQALKRLFREERTERVKDALAAAIAVAANEDLIGDVIALARDTSIGSGRILLLSALERSKDPRARAALMDLSTDPDLILEIKEIQKRFARNQARRAKRAEQAKQPKPAEAATTPAKATKPAKR